MTGAATESDDACRLTWDTCMLYTGMQAFRLEGGEDVVDAQCRRVRSGTRRPRRFFVEDVLYAVASLAVILVVLGLTLTDTGLSRRRNVLDTVVRSSRPR